MNRLESELEVLESEVQDLDNDIDRLRREVADAERLDERISRAPTGYDRAMLHQECANRFGPSSPREVLRDRRSAMHQIRNSRQAKGRQAAAVERNIKKVEARIGQIAVRASRLIRALVIDGNNLCYQGGQFIGLAALKPLSQRLADSFDVTIIFDASIRRHLGLTDRALRAALPSANVHVVASRGKANETVLHVARDPFVYVLSNDRYAEYPDEPPVRENRLIRHEIVNGRVMVHDLLIDEPFFGRH